MLMEATCNTRYSLRYLPQARGVRARVEFQAHVGPNVLSHVLHSGGPVVDLCSCSDQLAAEVDSNSRQLPRMRLHTSSSFTVNCICP